MTGRTLLLAAAAAAAVAAGARAQEISVISEALDSQFLDFSFGVFGPNNDDGGIMTDGNGRGGSEVAYKANFGPWSLVNLFCGAADGSCQFSADTHSAIVLHLKGDSLPARAGVLYLSATYTEFNADGGANVTYGVREALLESYLVSGPDADGYYEYAVPTSLSPDSSLLLNYIQIWNFSEEQYVVYLDDVVVTSDFAFPDPLPPPPPVTRIDFLTPDGVIAPWGDASSTVNTPQVASPADGTTPTFEVAYSVAAEQAAFTVLCMGDCLFDDKAFDTVTFTFATTLEMTDYGPWVWWQVVDRNWGNIEAASAPLLSILNDLGNGRYEWVYDLSRVPSNQTVGGFMILSSDESFEGARLNFESGVAAAGDTAGEPDLMPPPEELMPPPEELMPPPAADNETEVPMPPPSMDDNSTETPPPAVAAKQAVLEDGLVNDQAWSDWSQLGSVVNVTVTDALFHSGTASRAVDMKGSWSWYFHGCFNCPSVDEYDRLELWAYQAAPGNLERLFMQVFYDGVQDVFVPLTMLATGEEENGFAKYAFPLNKTLAGPNQTVTSFILSSNDGLEDVEFVLDDVAFVADGPVEEEPEPIEPPPTDGNVTEPAPPSGDEGVVVIFDETFMAPWQDWSSAAVSTSADSAHTGTSSLKVDYTNLAYTTFACPPSQGCDGIPAGSNDTSIQFWAKSDLPIGGIVMFLTTETTGEFSDAVSLDSYALIESAAESSGYTKYVMAGTPANSGAEPWCCINTQQWGPDNQTVHYDDFFVVTASAEVPDDNVTVPVEPEEPAAMPPPAETPEEPAAMPPPAETPQEPVAPKSPPPAVSGDSHSPPPPWDPRPSPPPPGGAQQQDEDDEPPAEAASPPPPPPPPTSTSGAAAATAGAGLAALAAVVAGAAM